MDTQKKAIFYFQITDVWKRHCELHSELLDLTFDEYSLLLDTDVEKLEAKTKEKQEIISLIQKNDELRNHVLDKIKSEDTSFKTSSVKDLIAYFSDFAAERESKHLFRFNALLIDIIEKIQEQNKKNQMFINKAINSLREIREEASGTTTISTYNAKGISKNRTIDANS